MNKPMLPEIRDFLTVVMPDEIQTEWGAVHPDSELVWSFSDQAEAESFALQYRTSLMKRLVIRTEWVVS